MNAWPTTGEVRATFTASDRLAFDRWLTDHDAKVRAEALREAAKGMRPGLRGGTCNEGCHKADQIALEMRADRIERGESS